MVIDVAFKILQNVNKKINFIFVGQDRGIKKNLEIKLEKLNIFNNFIFIENIKNPIEILLISEISILVSKHEGFSNSILESMSVGLPIIANVGGNKEV